MEADDGGACAGVEAARQIAEELLERAQLVVDGDAQRLERARGRIDALFRRARHAAPHQVGQLARRADRLFAPRPHNSSGDAAAQALLAILIDYVGQLLFAQPRDQPPSGLAAFGIKAQIEWAIALEAE